jgi:hypothetical protein
MCGVPQWLAQLPPDRKDGKSRIRISTWHPEQSMRKNEKRTSVQSQCG